MKELRIPLRAVLYREDDHWIAHCLELDLLGDGANPAEAVQMMVQAILSQIESCRKHEAAHALFTPAEGKYFEMFAAGKDVVVDEIVPSLKERLGDPVRIESLEARQYSDPVDAADSDLLCTL